jgi:hypothetical protein
MLVIALTAAGLAAASVAVWYQHRQTRRALDLWGAAAAQSIERAAVVELVELEDGGRAGGSSAVGIWDAEKAINISRARGLLHFRRSLLQDANFDWNSAKTPTVSNSEWDYAVRFSDEDDSVVVLFDLAQGLVANRALPERVARVTERTSRGLELFFEEAIAAAE